MNDSYLSLKYHILNMLLDYVIWMQKITKHLVSDYKIRQKN